MWHVGKVNVKGDQQCQFHLWGIDRSFSFMFRRKQARKQQFLRCLGQGVVQLTIVLVLVLQDDLIQSLLHNEKIWVAQDNFFSSKVKTHNNRLLPSFGSNLSCQPALVLECKVTDGLGKRFLPLYPCRNWDGLGQIPLALHGNSLSEAQAFVLVTQASESREEGPNEGRHARTSSCYQMLCKPKGPKEATQERQHVNFCYLFLF